MVCGAATERDSQSEIHGAGFADRYAAAHDETGCSERGVSSCFACE
jgi:hypothetical protein